MVWGFFGWLHLFFFFLGRGAGWCWGVDVIDFFFFSLLSSTFAFCY